MSALRCGFGQEDEFSGPLLTCGYLPRIPDTADFARRNRVLLLAASNGVPIDIALAALPFENLVVQRSSLFVFERGGALRSCSAEDLIVLQLFAFQPRDLLDVETVDIRQGDRLDWNYIETNLTPLADVQEEPGIMKARARLRPSL